VWGKELQLKQSGTAAASAGETTSSRGKKSLKLKGWGIEEGGLQTFGFTFSGGKNELSEGGKEGRTLNLGTTTLCADQGN